MKREVFPINQERLVSVMGFKVKKTKKQKIVGTITFLLFAFIIFCICYFLTYFFTLPSTTHEGEKIVEGDWKVVIAEGYGYNAPQGVTFTFNDNGRFTIKYEDGEKIASGFFKIKVENDKTEGGYGTIKLLMLPFVQNFPEEWDMGQLRSNISWKFTNYPKDRDGIEMYRDSDYNVMSNTLEFQTEGTIFKLVLAGSEEEANSKTSNGGTEE